MARIISIQKATHVLRVQLRLYNENLYIAHFGLSWIVETILCIFREKDYLFNKVTKAESIMSSLLVKLNLNYDNKLLFGEHLCYYVFNKLTFGVQLV